MKITWVGTDDNVRGNIEFITDKKLIVVLTAEEIKTLYEASLKSCSRALKQEVCF